MTPYLIIRGNPARIESVVNDYVRAGYIPMGGLCRAANCDGSDFFQVIWNAGAADTRKRTRRS